MSNRFVPLRHAQRDGVPGRTADRVNRMSLESDLPASLLYEGLPHGSSLSKATPIAADLPEVASPPVTHRPEGQDASIVGGGFNRLGPTYCRDATATRGLHHATACDVTSLDTASVRGHGPRPRGRAPGNRRCNAIPPPGHIRRARNRSLRRHDTHLIASPHLGMTKRPYGLRGH